MNDHESYHLIYHYMCLFCNESLDRFKDILTEKDYWELFDERRFEESISCHYCSKMFHNKESKQRHKKNSRNVGFFPLILILNQIFKPAPFLRFSSHSELQNPE